MSAIRAQSVSVIARELLQAATGTLDGAEGRAWPVQSSAAYDQARARVVEAIFARDDAALKALVGNATHAITVVGELARRAPDLFPGGLDANRTANFREEIHA